MGRSLASDIATRYWADHLGLPHDALFAAPLRIVSHGGELEDYAGVFALCRGPSKIISLPPSQAEILRPMLSTLSAESSLEELVNVLQPVTSVAIGPAFIGYAEIVPLPSHEVRILTTNDAPAASVLQAACCELDWQHGGSDIRDRPVSGVFRDDQLVALAGYEVLGGTIAQISVITHPDHRGHGLGTSAVAHLSSRALAAKLLPQYRTLDANAPSLSIAARLGFARYATSMAIRLVSDP
jgi:GNAT superfamily N-acetyltransferase